MLPTQPSQLRSQRGVAGPRKRFQRGAWCMSRVLEPFHERGASKYIRLDTYMGTHGLTGVLSQLLRRFWRNGDGDVTGTALAYWRLDR